MTFELRDIAFAYKGKASTGRAVVNRLNLSAGLGECVGVIGQEGAGKTTLLQLMNGLLKPDQGTVRIDGTDIWQCPDSISGFRQRIGFAFQFPEQQFFCETIRDELLYASVNFGDGLLSGGPTPEQALALVGLHASKFLSRSPFTLSMGEARRVALAIVLMAQPRALLLDEPTAGLDGKGIDFVVNLLRRMKDQQVTTVLVSHDVDVLAEVASRVIVLEEGEVRHDLPVEEILINRELLGAYGYELPEIVRFMSEYGKRNGGVERRLYTVNEARALPGFGRTP